MMNSVKKVVEVRDEVQRRLGLDNKNLGRRLKALAGGDFHAGRALAAYAKRFAKKLKAERRPICR